MKSQGQIGTATEWAETKKAAELLGVSKSFLDKARMDGSGPPYAKIGAAVRYHIPTVRVWASDRMRRSTSEAEPNTRASSLGAR